MAHVDPEKMIAARKRERRLGNCTSAPSPESFLRPSRTIRAHAHKIFGLHDLTFRVLPAYRWVGAGELPDDNFLYRLTKRNGVVLPPITEMQPYNRSG